MTEKTKRIILIAAGVLLCAALVVVSYLLSLTLLKRKVFRVNMVECLKDNRA